MMKLLLFLALCLALSHASESESAESAEVAEVEACTESEGAGCASGSTSGTSSGSSPSPAPAFAIEWDTLITTSDYCGGNDFLGGENPDYYGQAFWTGNECFYGTGTGTPTPPPAQFEYPCNEFSGMFASILEVSTGMFGTGFRTCQSNTPSPSVPLPSLASEVDPQYIDARVQVPDLIARVAIFGDCSIMFNLVGSDSDFSTASGTMFNNGFNAFYSQQTENNYVCGKIDNSSFPNFEITLGSLAQSVCTIHDRDTIHCSVILNTNTVSNNLFRRNYRATLLRRPVPTSDNLDYPYPGRMDGGNNIDFDIGLDYYTGFYSSNGVYGGGQCFSKFSD